MTEANDDNEGDAGEPVGDDSAFAVETMVVEVAGQWAVDIVVAFADGVVRKRIQTYRTAAKARRSADIIRRAAARELRPPDHR
ncbi:MAG: hypothetical protein ACK5MP_01650 [Nostocoides sp.]